MNVASLEEEISGFEIGAVDKISYLPGIRTHNRYQIFQEKELEVNGLEDNAQRGKITIDSGAAESVWPHAMLPEITTKLSKGSQQGVMYVATNGSKMPNRGREEGALPDEGRDQVEHYVPGDGCQKTIRCCVEDRGERKLGMLRPR